MNDELSQNRLPAVGPAIGFRVLLCNERNRTLCCKFTQLHSYQILLKLVNIWLSYRENQKGELFETQCMH